MRELAYQNIQNANYALDALTGSKKIRKKFSGPIFNEFVFEFPGGWKKIDKHLRSHGVLGGFDLEPHYPELKDCALFCVTEVHRKAEIDRVADLVKEAAR
jgi:glycine dehydrogenase subunit 1